MGDSITSMIMDPDLQELIDSIVDDHPELAKDRTLLSQFLSVKDNAENAVQVFKYLNLVRAGGLLSKMESVLSAFSLPPGVSELTFIVDTLIEIGKANRTLVEYVGQKAYAYGVTSWAFQHAPVNIPRADYDSVLTSTQGTLRAPAAALEWTRMRDAAIRGMILRCFDNRIPETVFKRLLQFRFRHEPNLLAKAIFAGLGATLKQTDRSVRDLYFKVNYPD
jgi:hypothetical protein